DEGNMHLLLLYATDDQRERYLRPLIEGKIRSCFAMSEPAPGAGSDPTMMQTRAVRAGGGWEISGRKGFTTGAGGAAFAITMAVTDEQKGVTIFLVPTDTPGFRVVRTIATMGGHEPGHGEVQYDAVRVPESAVLGKVGDGFKMAQVRLT